MRSAKPGNHLNSIFSFVFKKLEWLSATPLATLRLLQFLPTYKRASVTWWLHAARLSFLKLIWSDLHVGRKTCVVLLLTMDGYHGYATGNAISIADCASVWSNIFPLYVSKIQLVTRDMKLASWYSIFCPLDIWCWVTRCVACKGQFLSHTDLWFQHRRLRYSWRSWK